MNNGVGGGKRCRGLYLLTGKLSYHYTSWSVEVTKSTLRDVLLLWRYVKLPVAHPPGLPAVAGKTFLAFPAHARHLSLRIYEAPLYSCSGSMIVLVLVRYPWRIWVKSTSSKLIRTQGAYRAHSVIVLETVPEQHRGEILHCSCLHIIYRCSAKSLFTFSSMVIPTKYFFSFVHFYFHAN